jgi:hypothetical protein
VNRSLVVSRTLWVGTLVGVLLCATGAALASLGRPSAWPVARLGVLAFLVTPPVRLLVVALSFWQEGRRRLALAAATVLAALIGAAIHAVL